jgi:hypothetical protein
MLRRYRPTLLEPRGAIRGFGGARGADPRRVMRFALLAAASLIGLASLAGCRRREPPEAARNRAAAAFLQEQIRSLETLVAKAEGAGLETQGQIAIGISEELVKGLLNASLPREVVLADRLRLRLESGEAIFRGNRSGLVLRARISGKDTPGASATVEMAGALKEFEFEKGQLVSRVSVLHFSVIESSMGNLAADVIENLVKPHLSRIDGVIPPVVIPVDLEESVKIGGLTEGAVVANSGMLPLAIKVAQVLPINGRLWAFLDARAGPWRTLPPPEKP